MIGPAGTFAAPKAEEKEGYNCETCGARHVFNGYVFAHWDMPLTHTCDSCGAKHEIRRGIAVLMRAGKKTSAA